MSDVDDGGARDDGGTPAEAQGSEPAAPSAPVPTGDPVADAVALAEHWIAQAAGAEPDPAAARLAGVLQDPNGLPFTIGFVDGVMRPESLAAAGQQLSRIAPLAPAFLPWYLRAAVRLGGAVAPVVPWPVVPIARRALRGMVGHLVADARQEKLGPAIEKIRASGARLNLNLLGEAVLGEGEAKRRLSGIRRLVRRDDVDYVSVKVSAVASRLSMWAFDEMVDRIVARLEPLFLEAAEKGTFVNLDMEEYRDLDLTVAVFTRLLEDPRLTGLHAGIVLQAYLPDSLPALQELTAWARGRVAAGGAPIKVRLVKGANLPMEHVEARMHGWALATYDSKLDTDANYLRLLDWAMDAERIDAVRIGVAGHNLFDIGYAWMLAGVRGVRDGVEFEMLLGMAQGQVEQVSREVGPVRLYVPVVAPAEFDVAISYLVRRLEENASEENFLSAAFRLHEEPALLTRERDRFLAAVRRSKDRALPTGPRRSQRRQPEERTEAVGGATQQPLTEAVVGISRGAGDEDAPPSSFVTDAFTETAVLATHESGTAQGAPGFRNTQDTDPALAESRRWGREVLARIPASTAGEATVRAARITDAGALRQTVAMVRDAAASWGVMPAADRSEVLRRAADELEARRALLIEVAGAEAGKVLAEADVEVSEAVDFARYYAATARELDAVSGARFVPSRVTVVSPPWNFPLAIPSGGVLAALAAGSGVVFKPSAKARRCAAVIAEALWAAGVPRELLALVDIDSGELGRELISHQDVDRVILTGSWDTARRFRSWRPELPLLAETSGKNAMIVTPTADLDLAAADLVRSAFGHAGQKCSAASLAILVGPVAGSRRFARQLVDATRSMRVGPPSDPLSEMGPVIERPTGKLAWALSTLDPGEEWLVEPKPLPGGDGRYWTPGIRTGVQEGSRFHLEEFFGPVLGVIRASTLEHAIRIQNAVAYGLTAGLYTQHPDDLAAWIDRVEAGNLYVNRGTTGAIVQRQPFGGWKRSSVGAGAKAGGPNYLIGLGSWRSTDGGAAGRSLHLRGLDTRIARLIEAAQPALAYQEFEWLRRAALSDAIAWDREFGRVKDVSGLGVERNLFRYRPAAVSVRATDEAPLQAQLRAAIAGVRVGGAFVLSTPRELPPAVRAELEAVGVRVRVESDREWVDWMAGHDAARAVDPAGGSLGDGSAAPASPADEPAASAVPTHSADAAAPAADAAVGPADPDTAEATSGADGTAAAETVELADLIDEIPRPGRARLIGPASAVAALRTRLAEATDGDPDLAVYANELTTAGRIELLPFLHEQAISITAHRFGNPDDWSRGVI